MTDLVPAEDIEGIVGVSRHAIEHWGRALAAEQTVYVMHSAECLEAGLDLRDCEYSIALDSGIDLGDWTGHEDRPVRLAVDDDGWLVPYGCDAA